MAVYRVPFTIHQEVAIHWGVEMDLKRDIEAIYVLEPWYSKMRQELEREKWVQDNVFWEQCRRSLDKLTKRVIPELAEIMLTNVWNEGYCTPKEYMEEHFWVDDLGLKIEGDGSIRLSSVNNPDKFFRRKEEYLAWYSRPIARLDFVDIPIGEVLKDGLANIVPVTAWRGVGTEWVIPAQYSSDIIRKLRPYGERAIREKIRHSKFPYSGSMESLVSTVQGSHFRAKYNRKFARAVDRLRDSYQGGLPERILAINIALNVTHASGLSAASFAGVSNQDLDRWSRMGVQSKATAKQYLESKTATEAIDMLLEGVGLPRAIAWLEN